jgi:hypothetical protein
MKIVNLLLLSMIVSGTAFGAGFSRKCSIDDATYFYVNFSEDKSPYQLGLVIGEYKIVDSELEGNDFISKLLPNGKTCEITLEADASLLIQITTETSGSMKGLVRLTDKRGLVRAIFDVNKDYKAAEIEADRIIRANLTLTGNGLTGACIQGDTIDE